MATPVDSARSASTARRRGAEDTAAAEMKKLLEKLNGIVEGLVTENAALTARLDTVEVAAKTTHTSMGTRIAALETENKALHKELSEIKETLGAVQTTADRALRVAGYHYHDTVRHNTNVLTSHTKLDI